MEQAGGRREKPFVLKGKDPVNGKGSYHHPTTGRKYYLDKAGKIYKEGTELPHVDVHRINVETGMSVEKIEHLPKGSKLLEPKKKFPIGEKLVDQSITSKTVSNSFLKNE